MYKYKRLKQLICVNKPISKFEIFISSSKWKELFINQYLRFFRHNRYKICNDSICIIKLCAWSDSYLLNDYKISKKYKHLNMINHECYFEYEEDIIHFLCNDLTINKQFEDINEFNSVLITPKFKSFEYSDIDNLNQIVMFLFFLFYKHGIGFKEINIQENILIDKLITNKTIIYNIEGIKYKILTNNIIKFDNNINIIEKCKDENTLYNCICLLFIQIRDCYKIDISYVEEILKQNRHSIRNIVPFFHSFSILTHHD